MKFLVFVLSFVLTGSLYADKKGRPAVHVQESANWRKDHHNFAGDWRKDLRGNTPKGAFRIDAVRGKPVAPVNLGVNRVVGYHTKFGATFPKGHPLFGKFYYRGWDHRHWTHWKYYQRYGTYLYWDPGVSSWYYWCAPDCSYYPISYVPYGAYAVQTNTVINQNGEVVAQEQEQQPPEPPQE